MTILETAPYHFGDTIIERSRSLGHCFCLGLDPHLKMIPDAFRRGDMLPRNPETIAAVEDFLHAVVERAAARVTAVKPQSAIYERLGSPGVALLERICAYATSIGVPVLLDAKRGDIADTAQAYADAYLDPESPNPAKALTVNPYMGVDTLAPYLDKCRTYGRGIFVIVKTSNPGSGDFQDLPVGDATLYESVATALRPDADSLRGPATGWSSLGIVAGITYPGQAARIRQILPHALFLLPGYGHQGGDISRVAAALMPGPNGRLEGGLVSSSRGTLFPPDGASAGLNAWKSAFADKLDRDIAGVKASLIT
jgi:orotidine-5'-phosphate decarboxylase